MPIRSLVCEPLNVPLNVDFAISGGSHTMMRSVLIRVTLEDGTVGYGEAAPLPIFNGETQEAALRQLEGISSTAISKEPADCMGKEPHLGCVACAYETALWDAELRQQGRSFLDRWPENQNRQLETGITLPVGTVAQAEQAAAQASQQGFRALKFKVGSGHVEHDAACVVAACRIHPAARVILDGNAGLTEDQSLELCRELDMRGIEISLFEQPVAKDNIEALVNLRRERICPICADESACGYHEVRDLIYREAVDVVNVKFMKYGLVEGEKIIEHCRENGIRLMMGGMVETELAMTVSACYALGLGCFDIIDLDTPLFMAEHPLSGGAVWLGPKIDLSGVTLGHGVYLEASSS